MMNKLVLVISLFLPLHSFVYCADRSLALRNEKLTLTGCLDNYNGSTERTISWSAELSKLFFGDEKQMSVFLYPATAQDLEHVETYYTYRADMASEKHEKSDTALKIEKNFYEYAIKLDVDTLARLTQLTSVGHAFNKEKPFPKGLEYPWMEKIVTGKWEDMLLCTALQEMSQRLSFLSEQKDEINKKNENHAALLKQGLVARLILPYVQQWNAQPSSPVFNFSLWNSKFFAHANDYRCSKPTHAYVDNNVRILIWNKKLVFIDAQEEVQAGYDIAGCGNVSKNCIQVSDDGSHCAVRGDKATMVFVVGTKKTIDFDVMKWCCFGKNEYTNCLYFINRAGRLCMHNFCFIDQADSVLAEACDRSEFQGVLYDNIHKQIITWTQHAIYAGTFDQDLEYISKGFDMESLDDPIKINNVIINPAGTHLCVEICKNGERAGNLFSYALVDLKEKFVVDRSQPIERLLGDQESFMTFSPCGNFVSINGCDSNGSSWMRCVEVASRRQVCSSDVADTAIGEYKTVDNNSGVVTVGQEGLFSYTVGVRNSFHQVMIDGVNAIKSAQKYNPFTEDHSYEISRAIVKEIGTSGMQAHEGVLEHFGPKDSGGTLSFDRQYVTFSDESRVLVPQGLTLLLRAYDAQKSEIKKYNYSLWRSIFKDLVAYCNKLGPLKVFSGGTIAVMVTMAGVYKIVKMAKVSYMR